MRAVIARHRRSIVITLVVIAAALIWLRAGSLPVGLLDPSAGTSTVVVDRDGAVLYEARSDLGTREQRLAADALPPTLVAATLAAEDHRFFNHPGVDPVALVRATWRNLREWRRAEGGSTITQQVAKLLIDRQRQAALARSTRAAATPAGTVSRGWQAKVREAIVAIRLEHRLSKREILALYLNLAPYGNQITGVERASQAYFGGTAAMLTPAQAAFLAALPQRPSGFNPWRQPESARRRQRVVLTRMTSQGALTKPELGVAMAEQLRFRREASTFVAPHFVEMVLTAAGDRRPPRIATTLDRALQESIAGILRRERPQLDAHGAHNVAVVVLDNASGEWLAWEGSGNYHDLAHGGAIDGVTTPRQPGSALKPFTYALAFEAGRHPASVLADVPSHFPTAEPGIAYTPRNYDGRFRGPLLARKALAGSVNVPAVALASEVGVPSILRFLRRAGFSTFDRNGAHYGLGVTLGNAEVRLDELVGAYAALARGGTWIAPRFLRAPRVDDSQPGASRQLVDPRTAFWITDILSDASAREFIFGRGGSLELPFAVAVKTGTSQGYRDNWTVGYSSHVTVGVWVGNFTREPLVGSSGVTGAGPIFHAVMLAAERRVADRGDLRPAFLATPPAGVTRQSVCTLSGMRAHDGCPLKALEWVPAGFSELLCSWHHVSDEGVVTIWPPEYRAWARTNGLLTEPRRVDVVAGGPAARAAAARVTDPSRRPLEILNPPAGGIYLLDPTLRPQFQTLPLRVAGASRGQVDWAIDGRSIGVVHGETILEWPLVRGSHVVSVRDASGRTAETPILVK